MHKKLLLLFVLCLFMCAAGSAKDGTPHVVKRFNLYNQTGPIGPITLYTPKRSGMFRVNTFMVITVGNGKQGYLAGVVGFTDRVGPGQVDGTSNTGVYTANRGDAISGTIPVPDEGGQPLTFSVYAQDWQGAQYNVYIVVEEL
jgi:hypothetical protein